MAEKEQVEIEVELDSKFVKELEEALFDKLFNEFLTYLAKLGLQEYKKQQK